MHVRECGKCGYAIPLCLGLRNGEVKNDCNVCVYASLGEVYTHRTISVGATGEAEGGSGHVTRFHCEGLRHLKPCMQTRERMTFIGPAPLVVTPKRRPLAKRNIQFREMSLGLNRAKELPLVTEDKHKPFVGK